MGAIPTTARDKLIYLLTKEKERRTMLAVIIIIGLLANVLGTICGGRDKWGE